MSDLIYLVLGFIFGVIFMLNNKEYRQMKTYEQLDEEMRKELDTNKNLVKSLKDDLHWAKQKIQHLKEKQ